MAKINFLSLLDGPSRKDIVFRLQDQPKDEDPLVAHAVLLAEISPVFNQMIAENHFNRDADFNILLDINDADFKTFRKFLRGIYSKFSNLDSSFEEAKQLLQLASQFRVKSDIVENLLSLTNFWPCLEFALQNPKHESKLLQKCDLQLQHNKNLFDDKSSIAKLQVATIQHVLTLNQLPLSFSDLQEIVKLWEKQNETNTNFLSDRHILTESLMDFVFRHQPTSPWLPSLLNISVVSTVDNAISVPGHPPFTIKYDPQATIYSLYEQIHAAMNVPMHLFCIYTSGSTDPITVSGETLEALGIKAEDSLRVTLK